MSSLPWSPNTLESRYVVVGSRWTGCIRVVVIARFCCCYCRMNDVSVCCCCWLETLGIVADDLNRGVVLYLVLLAWESRWYCSDGMSCIVLDVSVLLLSNVVS